MTFNPHFARMHLETQPLWCRRCGWNIFQSSFCEDASWNKSLKQLLEKVLLTFNPHFARMHLETMHLETFNCILKDNGTLSFNPHFARMHLETYCFHLTFYWKLFFQSSFCEDASWNGVCKGTFLKAKRLSILILRGCILKHKQIRYTYPSEFCFQSSFCEDASWNIGYVLATQMSFTPFNPHFARMHLETRRLNTLHSRSLIFQSSFCEDASWNLIVHLLTYFLIQLTFNPHFARMHLETWKEYA